MDSKIPENMSENPDQSVNREAMAEQMTEQIAKVTNKIQKNNHPIRAVLFRGLGVILPPLLTIVIFLWVGATIKNYIVDPVFEGSRKAIVTVMADVVHEKDLKKSSPKRMIIKGRPGDETITLKGDKVFVRMANGTYVPERVYTKVSNNLGMEDMPRTGLEVYHHYVEIVYLNPYIFIPVLFVLFFFLVYLVGKFIAAGVGRFFWRNFEYGVNKVPFVRNVYGSVKQVIDLIFAEKELQFSRVVAVEWPRKGVWAIALVTGEGLFDLDDHVGEPHYSVLVPTSPMPMTGFTLNFRKSETIELNISIDQAIQFIVSCGVVVPLRPIG